MVPEHVKVSNDHEKKSSEIKLEEGKPLVDDRKQDESCASPSSSLSSSSSSSSLEFGAGEKGNLETLSSASNFGIGSISMSSPEYLSSPDTSSHTSHPSLGSAWQMESPPIQTMGQPADYDPNRIPSSIFSSKPTSPCEWSVASNESLFSIHMGNSSFSRDNAILFGKSGELPPWLQEWNDNSSRNLQIVPEAKSAELSSLPPVMEVSAHEENDVKFDKVSRHDKSPKVAYRVNVKCQGVEKMGSAEEVNFTAPTTSSSSPRLSNESGHSSSSFAFPVLVSEGGKSRSLKVTTEQTDKPQIQSHLPKDDKVTTPKATETRWFSCVSCWPRWCC